MCHSAEIPGRTPIIHSFIFTHADFDAEIIYQFKMAHIHLCQYRHKVEENKMDERNQTYYYLGFLNIIAEVQFKEKGLTHSQFLINLLSSSMDVLSLSRSFK